MSGSNFGDDREGIGMNGLGVKLANILSTEFTIDLYDPIAKKQFVQTWEKNMSVVHPPVITRRNVPVDKFLITKVTIKPQMTLFNKQLKAEKIIPKIKNLIDIKEFILTRLATIAAIVPPSIKIYFNS